MRSNALTVAAKHEYKNRSTESMKVHHILINKFKNLNFRLAMITEECDNFDHYYFVNILSSSLIVYLIL